jgi:putative polyhydroxyalkanoate system protein
MANLTLDVEHGLDQQQAKAAAKLALAHYLERYGSRGLRATWSSDTRVDVEVEVRGAHLRGFIDVLPSKLQVTADVPFLLRPFKGVATAAIERETQRWAAQVKQNPAAQ